MADGLALIKKVLLALLGLPLIAALAGASYGRTAFPAAYSLVASQLPAQEPKKVTEAKPQYDLLELLQRMFIISRHVWDPEILHYECLLRKSSGKETTVNFQVPEIEKVEQDSISSEHEQEQLLLPYIEAHTELKQGMCAEVFREAALRLQLGNLISPVEDRYRSERIRLLVDITDSTVQKMERKREALENSLEDIANVSGFEEIVEDMNNQLKGTDYILSLAKGFDATKSEFHTKTAQYIQQLLLAGFHDSKPRENKIDVVDLTGVVQAWYNLESYEIEQKALVETELTFEEFPSTPKFWLMAADSLEKARDKAYELTSPKRFPDLDEFKPRDAADRVENIMSQEDLYEDYGYSDTLARLEYNRTIHRGLWHATAAISQDLAVGLEAVELDKYSAEQLEQFSESVTKIMGVYVDSQAFLVAYGAPNRLSPCRAEDPQELLGKLWAVADKYAVTSKVLAETDALVEKYQAAGLNSSSPACIETSISPFLDEKLK